MFFTSLSLRHAARQLFRAPGFTAVVVLTLGLGIGATAAVFSFVNGVLLRPLPYPQPEQIVSVCETNPEMQRGWCGGSPANWADWSRMSHTLESVGLARSWPFALKRNEKTVSIGGGVATPGLFQVFRPQPVLGRLFEPRDIEPGNEHVTILSHRFWQSAFGGSRDALGQRLDIDGKLYEIIGVLPAGFDVPELENIDAWIPLWPERRTYRGWRGFLSYGRMQPDVKLAQTAAEMESIRSELAQQFPETNKGWSIRVTSLHDQIVGEVRPALLVFLAAVTCVLLIACANVANLFLSHGASHEKEFAVRLALGAGRGRLVGQLLVENMLFAALGGAAGVLLSFWMVDFFRMLAPAWLPRLDQVQVSGSVLLFAVIVTLGTGVLFGLAPMLHAGDLNLSESLHEGRTASASRRSRRLREVLVVSEIALACLLLVGAGLLLRSFAGLLDWRPGFDRNNLAVVQVFSSPGKYPKAAQLAELFGRAAQEISTLPSVVSVGAGSAGPLFGGDGESEFFIEGRPIPPAGQRPLVAWYDVNPNYFATLRIPLRRGRFFTDADRDGAPLVAIINETMARRFWPDSNPVGQRVHMVEHDATFEIVGVVGDVRPFRSDRATQPEIYWPFAQAPRWAITFFVRTAGPPSQTAAGIRARLEQVDPDLSIMRLRTMDQLVNQQLVDPRFHVTLVGIFAALALVIALVGIYGVMSLHVAQRTHEIGVRLALGAERQHVLGLVLGRGMKLALGGLAAGLLAALPLTQLIRRLLVGVSPMDPLTYAGIALLLIGVAAAACYLPARRATRTNPLAALRCE